MFNIQFEHFFMICNIDFNIIKHYKILKETKYI